MNNYPKLLRNILKQNEIIVAPGVYDGISALVAKQAGFTILYVSGGAVARSQGFPDIGLVTMTELCQILGRIVETTQMPIIADADTGFGNEINVERTIKTYEQIGIAGLHIEDQTFPKRCGHLKNKSIISVEEMCSKVRAAKNAATNPDFLVIARTDAIAISGIEDAIFRANSYLTAGADMIFVEAPTTVEQMYKINQEINGPNLINMFIGGKTPLVTTDELKQMGYKLVIIPSDFQRASIKAMQKTAQQIMVYGNSKSLVNEMVSFEEREIIVNTQKYLDLRD